jgi:hypothetical protein
VEQTAVSHRGPRRLPSCLASAFRRRRTSQSLFVLMPLTCKQPASVEAVTAVLSRTGFAVLLAPTAPRCREAKAHHGAIHQGRRRRAPPLDELALRGAEVRRLLARPHGWPCSTSWQQRVCTLPACNLNGLTFQHRTLVITHSMARLCCNAAFTCVDWPCVRTRPFRGPHHHLQPLGSVCF